jgi:hypothetical protein
MLEGLRDNVFRRANSRISGKMRRWSTLSAPHTFDHH